ncbi:MAG TPA: dihydrodipicolinate reductase C-terminal domain-containing protein [Gemmatimonadales bacterium]|nr:dihydrodipicolinate reductase C-terminal domain-containing protein [Gemmatimonadales bacterium]
MSEPRTALRLALVGHGRMGRAVERLALERGHAVVAVLDRSAAGAVLASAALDRGALGEADVAIEFTRPEAAAGNLLALAATGVPVVTGTTGWHARLDEVRAAVAAHDGLLLYASNFSIGAQLCFRAARDLARHFRGRPEFDAYIVEVHHRAKLDAPSGTALTLQAAARAGDPARAVPITSVRAGHVPGTHTLAYDAPLETVSLEHTARSRDVFAAGALAAAEWLAAQRAAGRRGVVTFEDMLFGGEAPGSES